MQITYEFNPILVEKGLEWDLQIAENVEIMCDAAADPQSALNIRERL